MCPINPTGPRLIHPEAYSPGTGAPSASSTRPSAFGITPRTSSNATPSTGDPKYPTAR